MNILKTNACGVDNIDARMPKICLPLLMEYILHIFNYCIEKSTYPTVWKASMMKPIPKSC